MTMYKSVSIQFPYASYNIPSSKFKSMVGDTSSKDSWDYIHTFIQHHHFNAQVQVMSTHPMQGFSPVVYATFKGNLSLLLSMDWIQHIIQDDTFIALSVGDKIDTGNVIGIVQGKLYLAIDKDTYQQLGLSAQKAFYPKRGNRWKIVIDMTKDGFVGSSLHQRILWCFTGRTTDITMMVYSRDNLDFPEGSEYETHNSCASVRTCSDIQVPVLETIDEDFLFKINDWIGCITMEVESYFDIPDPFLSEFVLDMKTMSSPLYVSKSRGIFPSQNILTILNECKDSIDNSESNFIVLSVWGFEDSPVSWKQSEHSVLFEGVNDYHIILTPEKVILQVHTSPYDQFSS
eukprot:TRINITY_DN13147_c0_g1_i1.p1 TRINITY_DN13147_c0_g1~~TRINITY_DN13147_c0_g1_i1.p1  ORF type:complete len:345 (+),score=57.83 TRINITY_DN13147_c0_g1_i1:54-1088(+)